VDDALLKDLDIDRFVSILRPKVRGTWVLHELTRGQPLDFFVTFSSGAALLGSPGQGNYAAANAFMDALAHRRRLAGQHALSINWGSWSGAGMASNVTESHRRRWEAGGLSMIAPADGVTMLTALITANRHTQVAALPLTRSRIPANAGIFFSLLGKAAVVPQAAQEVIATADLLPRLASTPPEERRAMLQEFLAEQTVRVLALGSTHVLDRERSLLLLGMDSLMATELRNRVQAATKLKVSVSDLLKGVSINQLADTVLGQLGDLNGATGGDGWEEGTI
jgi:myxalamid-type polyketide synthase MxaB